MHLKLPAEFSQRALEPQGLSAQWSVLRTAGGRVEVVVGRFVVVVVTGRLVVVVTGLRGRGRLTFPTVGSSRGGERPSPWSGAGLGLDSVATEEETGDWAGLEEDPESPPGLTGGETGLTLD